MTRPDVNVAKTFVVIASDDDQLARAVAISLIDDKRALHEKFNGSKMPPWQAMTNHLPADANRDEIAASMADVLGRADRFMMVMSGYRDTPEWNTALRDFLRENRVSATFIVADGDAPPGTVRALFNAYTELPEESDSDPVDISRVAIKQARHHSSVPADRPHMH